MPGARPNAWETSHHRHSGNLLRSARLKEGSVWIAGAANHRRLANRANFWALGRIIPLLVAAALSILLSSCGSTQSLDVNEETVDATMEFSRRFSRDSAFGASHAGETSGSVYRALLVERRGLQKRALVLVAPVTIRAALRETERHALFQCLATPVFNVGDGFQIEVTLLVGGERKSLCTRYFDSGRRAEDRDWIPLSIPLSLGGVGESQLEIQISAGPQGDLVGDWLAMADIQVVERTLPK
jgi:hypothetical protein